MGTSSKRPPKPICNTVTVSAQKPPSQRVINIIWTDPTCLNDGPKLGGFDFEVDNHVIAAPGDTIHLTGVNFNISAESIAYFLKQDGELCLRTMALLQGEDNGKT